MRPLTIFTCGRSRIPVSPTPRINTFEDLSEPLRVREINTTDSFEVNRILLMPYATSGWLSTIAAWSRLMTLCISVSADLRVTTTLSGDPVSTKVFLRPSSSINTVANTNTTNAMPPAVSSVVSLRVIKLRIMYENGMAIFYIPVLLSYAS